MIRHEYLTSAMLPGTGPPCGPRNGGVFPVRFIAVFPGRVLRSPPPERLSREMPTSGHDDRCNDDPHRAGEREGIGQKVCPCVR
jgi:hypothetical protein